MTKLIGEISSNHNRNLKRCFKFIDVCSDLKFYTRNCKKSSNSDDINEKYYEIEKLYREKGGTEFEKMINHCIKSIHKSNV